MKAILYPAKGIVEVAEIDVRAPGNGEVLIGVLASGICQTDVEVLKGHYGTSAFPVVPGHEYCGVVVEVGAGVTGFAPGDRVVVDPNIECRHCASCLKGQTNLCASLRAYGVTENGGFAEFSTVAASALVPIGDMPFQTAALAEPVACVLNGIEAVGTGGVASALLFGAGPIGLLMALTLRTKAGIAVTLADIANDRLDLPRSLGFDVVRSAPNVLAPLRHAFDLVVDVTGVPAVVQGTPDYVANGGKVLFFGVCPPDARIEISPFEVFRRQLTLAGSHSLNHNIDEAIEMIGRIGPDIARLVSHQLPVADIAPFLLGKHSGPSLKVQAVWD